MIRVSEDQSNIIYGVDITKPVNPLMVRDAIVDCFHKAHGYTFDDIKDSFNFNSERELEGQRLEYIKTLIRQKFEEVQGDFENPKKDDLLKILHKLKEFSSYFRDQEIIEKHVEEIMQLIDKL